MLFRAASNRRVPGSNLSRSPDHFFPLGNTSCFSFFQIFSAAHAIKIKFCILPKMMSQSVTSQTVPYFSVFFFCLSSPIRPHEPGSWVIIRIHPRWNPSCLWNHCKWQNVSLIRLCRGLQPSTGLVSALLLFSFFLLQNLLRLELQWAFKFLQCLEINRRYTAYAFCY